MKSFEETSQEINEVLAIRAGFGFMFDHEDSKTMLRVAVDHLRDNKPLEPLTEYLSLKDNIPYIPNITDYYDGTTEHVNREAVDARFNADREKYADIGNVWSEKIEKAAEKVEVNFGDVGQFQDFTSQHREFLEMLAYKNGLKEILMNSEIFHNRSAMDDKIGKQITGSDEPVTTYLVGEGNEHGRVAVDITDSQQKTIDQILAKLDEIKSEGFNHISIGKNDYTIDTYTDAEATVWKPNPAFIISKEAKEIGGLDTKKVIEEDPNNSIRDIVQGTHFNDRNIETLKKEFQTKDIFVYPLDYNEGYSLSPSEVGNFLDKLNNSISIDDYKRSIEVSQSVEINKGLTNNSLNHKSSSIMENQETKPKRQKADIDLKIELPNSEKPFFEKKSTENNMFSQIKKAGSKLESEQTLNVSVNGKNIELSKNEIENPKLTEVVAGKLAPEKEVKHQAQGQKEPNTIPMEKNLDYLKDQIKFLGFGESADLHSTLEQKLKEKSEAFAITIPSDKGMFQNQVNHTLFFKKSANSDTVFFNSFNTDLTMPNTGEVRSHSFAVKNNGFTAKESINLLEGRAVKTEIKNKINGDVMEPAFVKLKLKEEKNEYGNYKMQVFNERYGVNTAEIADRFKLKFEDDKHKSITLKSLDKGNIVSVKFQDHGKVVDGKAILNPQYKSLNLYDKNMKRLKVDAPSAKADIKAENTNKAQKSHSRKM